MHRQENPRQRKQSGDTILAGDPFLKQISSWKSVNVTDFKVDGRWYSPPRVVGGLSGLLEVPPKGISSVFYLSNDSFQEKADKLGLTPGKHSVRLRTSSDSNPRPQQPKTIVVVSNYITVDISNLATNEERQSLMRQASAGGANGLNAVRRLIAQFPDAAIDAIKSGMLATREGDLRNMYIDLAGSIPGADSTTFLKSQLVPEAGVRSQVKAAEALKTRNQPDWEPPLLNTFRGFLSRTALANEGAYGDLISFLANTGSAVAIDALGKSSYAPVDTRLAIVQAFLPPGVSGRAGAQDGPGANLVMVVHGSIPTLPDDAAGAAIQNLLASALNDKEQRKGYERSFGETSVKDPRVCDVAAFVFALRWSERFQFHWSPETADRDAQVDKIRREFAEGR